jgi:hypothetical protein
MEKLRPVNADSAPRAQQDDMSLTFQLFGQDDAGILHPDFLNCEPAEVVTRIRRILDESHYQCVEVHLAGRYMYSVCRDELPRDLHA